VCLDNAQRPHARGPVEAVPAVHGPRAAAVLVSLFRLPRARAAGEVAVAADRAADGQLRLADPADRPEHAAHASCTARSTVVAALGADAYGVPAAVLRGSY